MPDQGQKQRQPMPPASDRKADGPVRLQVDKPNVDELLRRMRKVDPELARRYRQRPGQ